MGVKIFAALVAIVILVGIGDSDAGWVDPDTAESFYTTAALSEGDDREFELVFSDEFEQDGRTFRDGDDPRWTALDKNDYTNEALHFYSSDNVRTTNGVLNITTNQKENAYIAFNEKTKKKYVDTKHIQSAMIQGWNKFCLTGGIVEISAQLPGKSKIGGLWPALWLLGNLARATFVGSSDFVWPFSYNKCDPSTQVSQELNACRNVNHYGMKPGVGRGAPEIDLLEAMGGEKGKLPSTFIQRPYFSASLQIAPGVKTGRPVLGKRPKPGHWYTHLEYGDTNKTDLNPFFYGVTLINKPKTYTYQSDAISANMQINSSHFSKQHIYRVEWEPPDENGMGGYIKWFCDGEYIYGVFGDSLQITGTDIPSEPMYLIINTAVASSWGFPLPCPEGCDCECYDCGNSDCTCGLPTDFCKNIPAFFEIEYVRVYQAMNESKHKLGCSTRERPTELFIKGHAERYMSKDQKQPLLPVQKGGAACLRDGHCGGLGKGTCSQSGTCICKENFTGPTCLAHAGFDDNPYKQKDEALQVELMVFPKGLLLTLIVLIIGFCLSVGYNVAEKHREEKTHYKQINGISDHGGEIPQQIPVDRAASYQKILVPNSYSFPAQPLSQENVVTYCMIDGRMIDE